MLIAFLNHLALPMFYRFTYKNIVQIFGSFKLDFVFTDVTKAGKMVMSLMWKMCGIDVHCDTEIGKRLKALGQTLTTVTGDNDIANLDSVAEEPEQQQEEEEYVVDKDTDDDDADDADDECFDETDYKVKEQNDHPTENLEKEMWKQARKVNELR